MGRLLPQLPGYEVMNRIGEGAGAVISLGVEAASRKQVAIKHVLNHDNENEKFVIQAENEYEIAHGLDHPGIRKYYEIFRTKKWFKTRELFLIMEYIDGVRLEDHVPETFAERIQLFIEVAEALQAVHHAGYVHADIKPNNILICPDGRVKIIDFGQSCPLGHRKDRIQGTPDYMAPEQINRHPLDQRTDIYNLGASMYLAFTGKYFETMISLAEPGSPKHEIESRRANLPPHEINEDIPLALSKLISECCEARPDNRPRDMKAVISRLQTALHTLDRRENGADAKKPKPKPKPVAEKPKVPDVPADDDADDTFWEDLGLDDPPVTSKQRDEN